MGNTIIEATLINQKTDGNDVIDAVHITPVMQALEENHKKLLAKKKKEEALKQREHAKKEKERLMRERQIKIKEKSRQLYYWKEKILKSKKI